MQEKDIIEKIGDLPTLPTVAARINSEMQKASLTAKALGRIIADDTADAEYIAADLLAQAEHDPLASAILITISRPLVDEVNREVFIPLEIPEHGRNFCL